MRRWGIACIPRVLVADHLDVDSLASGGKEDTLDEVLVHPGLELTHPQGRLGLVLRRASGRGGRHVAGRGSAVRESHLAVGRASVGGGGAERRVKLHDNLASQHR